MATKNIARELSQVASLRPAGNRNASVNGASADLAAFESAVALIHAGTITDGTHTPKLQDSPDNSAWTDVAAAELEGAFTNIATNTDQKVGYKGKQRFLRVVVTVVAGATGGMYAATIVRGDSHAEPVA